jgi:site-specific DNA-methyltransferase (adenine-specific)
MNIDGCRLSAEGNTARNRTAGDRSRENYRTGTTVGGPIPTDQGRWPANVVLDEDAAAALDASVPSTRSRIGKPRGSAKPGDGWGMTATGAEYEDEGGPSRFFYTAKASRSERNAGLEGMPERDLNWSSGTQSPGTFQSEGTNRSVSNYHPTVKPLALMRWLVRLVTPAGGLVLDPFTGSGTTGVACVYEGRRFVGIELSDEYAAIARRRIAHAHGPLLVGVAE